MNGDDVAGEVDAVLDRWRSQQPIKSEAPGVNRALAERAGGKHSMEEV